MFFVTQFSYGQLINIETLRKNKKQGWQASVSANYQFTQNTRTISSFNANWGLQYSNNKHTLLIFGGSSILKIDTLDQVLNGGFEHIRYNYTCESRKWLTFEAFVQHQFNYIKYLQRRFINGYGPRFKLIDKDVFTLYLAPLVMFENEVYIDDYNTVTNQIKGDFILTFDFSLNDKVSMNHVTYYQPKLDDWMDYRISSQTGLYFTIIENLKFGVAFDFSYDAKPPVKDNSPLNKLFYSSQNFLSFSF